MLLSLPAIKKRESDFKQDKGTHFQKRSVRWEIFIYWYSAPKGTKHTWFLCIWWLRGEWAFLV